MKKTLLSCMIAWFLFLAVACEAINDDISMLIPYGSPQLASLYVQDDDHYDVDLVHGPDGLLAAFSSGSHDVIIAPISLGAKLALGNDSYRLLIVITWGNLFLATRDQSIQTIDDLENRSLILFGQQQVPDLVTRFILDHYKIKTDITYVDSVQTAISMMLIDDQRIALVAEPMLSVLRTNASDLVTLDLQHHYESITGYEYPQAGVFINRELDIDVVERLREDFEASIGRVNGKPLESAQLGFRLGIDIDPYILAGAIPGCNLKYRSASESRLAIEHFLLLFPISEDKQPEDSFYYE